MLRVLPLARTVFLEPQFGVASRFHLRPVIACTARGALHGHVFAHRSTPRMQGTRRARRLRRRRAGEQEIRRSGEHVKRQPLVRPAHLRSPVHLFSCSSGGKRSGAAGARPKCLYSMTFDTTPAPTVRPPSRMANRTPCSSAIGVISVALAVTLSPGMHISAPPKSSIDPVTSVVRK